VTKSKCRSVLRVEELYELLVFVMQTPKKNCTMICNKTIIVQGLLYWISLRMMHKPYLSIQRICIRVITSYKYLSNKRLWTSSHFTNTTIISWNCSPTNHLQQIQYKSNVKHILREWLHRNRIICKSNFFQSYMNYAVTWCLSLDSILQYNFKRSNDNFISSVFDFGKYIEISNS
jgi:hypothetical protein